MAIKAPTDTDMQMSQDKCFEKNGMSFTSSRFRNEAKISPYNQILTICAVARPPMAKAVRSCIAISVVREHSSCKYTTKC